MKVTNDDAVFTAREAADYMKGSTRSLERARADGSGPAFLKRGRVIRYRKADLDRWLEGQLQPGGAPETGR